MWNMTSEARRSEYERRGVRHGVGSTGERTYWVEVVASSSLYQHSTGSYKAKRRRAEIHTPAQSSEQISWHFPRSQILPALSLYTPRRCGPMVLEPADSVQRSACLLSNGVEDGEVVGQKDEASKGGLLQSEDDPKTRN